MAGSTADLHARRLKEVQAEVKRLAGWVGKDPAREPALVDARNDLVAHRIVGHQFTAAAPEAQEAVIAAAKLVLAAGPIGPYTRPQDAARYLRAAVNLGAVQAGLGLGEMAGVTMDSALEWADPMPQVQVAALLDARTRAWLLLGRSLGARAAGDLSRANAFADAAWHRLSEEEWSGDESVLAVDVLRLVSDARWAAGIRHDAVGALRRAVDAYAGQLAVLRAPGGRSQAHLERLLEPVPGLMGDLADRLRATGDVDSALVARRDLLEVLGGVSGQVGDGVDAVIAVVLAGLAHDLRTAGRHDEAAEAAEGARAAAGQLSVEGIIDGTAGERIPLGPDQTSWSPLDPATALVDPRVDAAALAAAEEAERLRAEAEERVREETARAEAARLEAEQREAARIAAAERAAWEAEQARLAAERAEAERAAAARSEQERIERERREAEERVLAEEAARAAAQRAREERMAAYQAEKEREAAEEAARLEAERAEEERARDERLEAERMDAERMAAELAEADRYVTEDPRIQELAAEEALRERLEAERIAAERAEAERLEVERLEAERIAAERAEAERLAAAAPVDALVEAQSVLAAARTAGERRAVRGALEGLIGVLRERVDAGDRQHAGVLIESLNELSGLRLRAADLFGSRAASREAKELSRRFG